MNGFAVTTYDGLEDVRILVDIIKKNWKENYFISLSSNCKKLESDFKKLNIDAFSFSKDVLYDDTLKFKNYKVYGKHDRSNLPFKRTGRINKMCRNYDGVKQSISRLYGNGVSYATHINGDAWPLSEKRYLSHIRNLKLKDKKFAFRGLGYGYYSDDAPLGWIDDHFFSFDVEHLNEKGFFDREGIELLFNKLSIHGVLAVLAFSKIGFQDILHYDDMSNYQLWPGRPSIFMENPNLPVSYSKKERFLHLNKGSFKNHLGKSLQAYFLKSNNLTKGDYIPDFLDKYLISDSVLFGSLENEILSVKKKMRQLWYIKSFYGDDLLKMNKTLKNNSNISILISNMLLRAYLFFLRFPNKLNYKHEQLLNHKDNLWPLKIEDHFKDVINKEHFPKKEKFWFDNFK